MSLDIKTEQGDPIKIADFDCLDEDVKITFTYEVRYINKDAAIQIIEHLKKEFGL